MGIYNEKGRLVNNGERFNGFELCPITGKKVLDSNLKSPINAHDGYEYILLTVNPNVVIGMESHILNNEDAYTKLRKHSEAIVQMIRDCKKPFFEMDSVLLNELENRNQ